MFLQGFLTTDTLKQLAHVAEADETDGAVLTVDPAAKTAVITPNRYGDQGIEIQLDAFEESPSS